MKKNSILAFLLVAIVSYSCNVAKTCPTYAKAPSSNIEKAHKR